MKFWQFYRRLPETIRRIADDNYIVLKQDPKHPAAIQEGRAILVGACRHSLPRRRRGGWV
jgi:hypothetical protein